MVIFFWMACWAYHDPMFWLMKPPQVGSIGDLLCVGIAGITMLANTFIANYIFDPGIVVLATYVCTDICICIYIYISISMYSYCT